MATAKQQGDGNEPVTNNEPQIPGSPNDDPEGQLVQQQKQQQQPPAQPKPPGGVGEEPIMTTEQLNERLARERRNYLTKLGYESEEALLKERREREELAKQREEEERQKMSEVERYRSDLEKERKQREQLEEQYAAAQFEQHVTKVCATMGVKNVEYAMFEVMRATDSTAEGDQLDVAEHLKKLAEEDESKRASLGIAPPPPPVESNPSPATTTPEGHEPPTPPPGQEPQNPDAFSMEDGAWRARKAALGLP